jgi:hypothetical protein
MGTVLVVAEQALVAHSQLVIQEPPLLIEYKPTQCLSDYDGPGVYNRGRISKLAQPFEIDSPLVASDVMGIANICRVCLYTKGGRAHRRQKR